MPARRVILDTNVLLSGIFFGGVPGRLLEAWQDNQLALVLYAIGKALAVHWRYWNGSRLHAASTRSRPCFRDLGVGRTTICMSRPSAVRNSINRRVRSE